MKISQKVPLIASAIVIIAFTVFSWFQYNMVRKALYGKLESNVSETSLVLANQITIWLSGKLALIDMAANTIAVDYSPEKVQESMDNPILKKEFKLVGGALETDGKPISNTPSWDPGEDWDGRKRPWYSLARSRVKAVLTDPYTDSESGQLIISAVASIKDKSSFRGAFGGDMVMQTVLDAINNLNFNNTGYAFLLNSDRKIINHPDTSLNGKLLDSLFITDYPTLNTNLQELQIGDQTVITRFTRLKGLELDSKEWLVGVVLDKKKAMAEADTLKMIAAIGALLSGLVSSLVLYLTISHLLLTPIKHLIEVANEMSLGKLDIKVHETERKDEIGDLANALTRMGVSIQLAIKKLQKN